ncbi:MAG TPA: glycosyltransferase, partial [Thermoanaerobaculia bacterium]|nr:glycosyltransferase [Thermoanaerobaculia bacterium]
PEELAGVLGSCEIVAGMRLHSLVFACMTGVPFVALDYDPKVRLHARLLDPPPPVLPIAELQSWSLRQALERVSRAAAAWGERGRALAAEMRRRAGRNDEIARELLDRPPGALPRSLRRPIFDFLRERAEVRAAGTGADDGSAGLRAPAWPPALANPVPLRGVSPGVRVLTPAFFDARGERVFRGGAERYLVELGKVVRGLGHSIEVFQLAQGEAWTREVDGLLVHGLPARDYTLLERAALTATGTRPELTVHLAFYTAGPDTTGPALGISHGVYWDDPGSQAPSQFRWHREHVLRAVEHLDGMVSVDTNTINWVGATSSRLAGKIVYIPNFVDLEDFRPVPRPEGARTVLLFPRRLVAARGFWLVAEILPRLLARHPDIEFHFVGDAAGAEEDEVRRLVALDPERVRWTSLPPERMPGAYQAADVVLIPTLWSEGTSLSCLEAQAAGRAVIATRVGGLPDLVLPGYNGLLIEPNAAALEAAALRLIADPGLRGRLAAKGLETVQGFGIERWREHWEDLLRTYLERRDDAMNDRRPQAEAGELGALRARQAELEGTLARLRAEAVEKEIRQRLLLFEQGVEFGDLKAGLESARDERLAQAVAGLSSLEIRHRALEAEKRDLELERAGLRDQREWLLAERNDLARRLSETEGTLAYRIVSKFWRLMRTLFPEGSRRRKLYRGMRRAIARLLGAGGLSPETAWTTGTGGAPSPSGPGSPEEPPPDFRADLIRFEDEVRASGSPVVVAIFSATQLLESEGQRPTQLALTLSRRGVPVVFVYWRWWDHEWRPQDRLEEGIVQIPIDVVTRQPEMLSGAFEALTRILLFEFPHPGFFETLSAANSAGWITVYDVLDDWEEFHRVGQAIWYDEEFERHLITAADAVFAINDFLAGRIRELGGSSVEIVGNGLKPGLERIREPRPLERGEVTVGYFGYLAGAWFDWELIAEAARRRPSWRFYLIGYGGSPEEVRLPETVVLLGKQPQVDLAAYAANWDVALIPFKPDRLAAGADPIKTYEYLAMGLPVVATGVYPPAGGEAFVTRAEGVEGFLCAIEEAAAQTAEDAGARRAFAATCTWDHRLTAMLTSIEEGRQRVAEKQALFESRR